MSADFRVLSMLSNDAGQLFPETVTKYHVLEKDLWVGGI